MTFSKNYQRVQFSLGRVHIDALGAFAEANNMSKTKAVEILIEESEYTSGYPALEEFVQAREQFEDVRWQKKQV